MSDTALAVVQPQSFELSVNEVKNQVEKIKTLMTDLMREGEHYGGSFPGDTKKSLHKPGADKLCFMFRLRPDFEQEIKELPGGHIEVLSKCKIYHIESGTKIAEGVGMASTMESKYRWRNAAKKCPECGKETIIKGKAEYGGGWLCYGKKGGCGAKFADGDQAIEGQVVGKVENADIADVYNTVLKISKKRAYVDATITATAASDVFSQDADELKGDKEKEEPTPEDLAKEAAGNGKKENPPQQKAPPPNHTVEDNRALVESTGKILKSLDPDGLPYFTDAEIAQERAVSDGSRTWQNFKNQNERLANILEKRKAAYGPVPFGDDEPPMWKENTTDGKPLLESVAEQVVKEAETVIF
ncbi:hypothetical protein AGMMS49940_22630 [Spirochaetia bacterium]|nr:hypothetical protein AGMMS49940_22630 [Spirochaetia bacterium]